VIFDLLWGEPAMAAVAQAVQGVRLVQIGQLAAVEARLAAPLVRSRAVDIRRHAVFKRRTTCAPPRTSNSAKRWPPANCTSTWRPCRPLV